MPEKVIFLDIDGVLNWYHSKSHCGLYLGIDTIRIKRLAKIVEATGAAIVLTTTWKDFYEIGAYKQSNRTGIYMNNKFRKTGLKIYDSAMDVAGWAKRGAAIKTWLDNHPEVKEFVILDDEIFNDYETYDYLPHMIKTMYRLEPGQDRFGGLTDYLVEKAIDILNGKLPEHGPTIDKDWFEWYRRTFTFEDLDTPKLYYL